MRYSPRSLTATALVAAAASPALAQWSSDPAANTPVVTTPAAQTVTKSAVAADGSSWMGWFDFNAPSIQVRVQRLDATGQRTFSPEGLLVSDEAQNTSVVDWDMRVDSQGNCMLAFVDIRDGGDNDVHAYLIAPDGTMLWGETGVTVSDNAEFEADPRIVQLSGGDYAVVWPRFDVNPGLVMQRISPAGVKAFGGDGVLIISSGTEEPAFVEVEPTSDNGFMIAYVRNIASFLSPRHIRAQKFNADGQPQWGASPVIVSQATAVPIAHRPRLLNDGADGAVIAWHDTRDGDFDCYLQRITPAGATVFAANGVAASSEPLRQQLDPAIAMAPSGDVLMFFRNMDSAQSNQSMNVQRFDNDGSQALGSTGVALTAYNNQFKGPPRAVSTAAGAAGVFDRQPVLGNSSGTLEMLMVDEAGTLVPGSVISVSTADSAKGRLTAGTDPSGNILVCWSDDRNGDEDVYVQRVLPDGILPGGCPADLAEPFGTLNFFDISVFLGAFNTQNPVADFAAPFGEFNFFDVSAFLSAYNAGCP